MKEEDILSLKASPRDPKDFLNHRFVDLFVIVLSFLVIFASYVAIKPFYHIEGIQDGIIAKIYGGLLLLVLGSYVAFEAFRKKLTFQKAVIALLLLAFIIHLTYMLYTPYDLRQHDMAYDAESGHYSYAISFYETWSLPTQYITADTVYQFYHPPLNAFLQGAFMHLFQAVVPLDSLTGDLPMLYGSNEILSCFYMGLTSYYLAKTILLSKLRKPSMILAIAFVALFPRLIQLSGQLNNDAISILFSVLALYTFCQWYFRKKTFGKIALTGLFTGLALFAKMSAAIICLGMAVCFVIEIVRSLKKKEGSLPFKQLALQYGLFLAICAPIGLWFQFYSHFVYGLPFNFVFKNLNSALFTGTRDWVAAFQGESALGYYDHNNSGLLYTSPIYNILVRYILPIYPEDFLLGKTYFCNAWGNYNLLSYALRSSMFGEFSYWNADGLVIPSILLVYAVWIQLVVFLVGACFRHLKIGRDGTAALYLIGGILLLFFYLQIKMPFGCSMDFRYIVPIILPIGYLLGKENDLLSGENPSAFQRLQKTINLVATTLFLTSTTLFYFFAL